MDNMRVNDPTKQGAAETCASSRKKKAYQKPAFRYERVFETAALWCGKISTTQWSCKASVRTS
jgi:hypothetical protein